MPDDNFEPSEERAAAKISQLYATHKARGSLGTFCGLYPENAPLEYRCPPPRQREDGGREH